MATAEPTLVIHAARWKAALGILACLPFTWMFAFSLLRSDSLTQVIAATGGLLFVASSVFVMLISLIKPDRIVLTSEGFRVEGRKNWPLTRWGDVEPFFVWGRFGSQMASWSYRPGAEPEGVMETVSKAIGTPASVGLGWNMSPGRLADVLNQWRETYGAPASNP